MNTTTGSFGLTEGAVNITYHAASKLRLGAQTYDRKIGVLGRGNVTLDWGGMGIPDGSPFQEKTARDFTHQFYVQYLKRKTALRRRVPPVLARSPVVLRQFSDRVRSSFGQSRLLRIDSVPRRSRLELGTYYSQYYADWHQKHDWRGESYTGLGDPPDNHIFDWDITAHRYKAVLEHKSGGTFHGWLRFPRLSTRLL